LRVALSTKKKYKYNQPSRASSQPAWGAESTPVHPKRMTEKRVQRAMDLPYCTAMSFFRGKHMSTRILLVVVLCAVLTGCITTLSTKKDDSVKAKYYTTLYGIVFFKAIEASSKLGWKIRSDDYTQGVIRGETIYGGGGKPKIITIELSEETGTVRVDVTIATVNPDLKLYFSRQIKKYLTVLDTLINEEEL
jgi:hypothetical protein